MINGRTTTCFSMPETQTCYPPVGIVYNPTPLPLLSGSTVLLTDENSLSNCSLNHSPISCPLIASASLDLLKPTLRQNFSMYTSSWNSGNHFWAFWIMDFKNDTFFCCSASLSDNSLRCLTCSSISCRWWFSC